MGYKSTVNKTQLSDFLKARQIVYLSLSPQIVLHKELKQWIIWAAGSVKGKNKHIVVFTPPQGQSTK